MACSSGESGLTDSREEVEWDVCEVCDRAEVSCFSGSNVNGDISGFEDAGADVDGSVSRQ